MWWRRTATKTSTWSVFQHSYRSKKKAKHINGIIENNKFDNKEPENDIEDEEDLDEYNNESLDWYEAEVYEESFDEHPPKKKRGRPPKLKIEGTIYHFEKRNTVCTVKSVIFG